MLFLSYKYTSVENKDKLVQDLLEIAKYIESLGFSTFLLGRDNNKWSTSSHISAHKYLKIIANIFKCEGLVIIYNSDVHSFGMNFETVFATLLGKPIYILNKENLKRAWFHSLARKIVTYSENNIQESIKELLV